MNKKISLLLVLALLGTFTACGSNHAPSQESTAVSSAISSSEAASTEPASTDSASTGATASAETAATGTAGEEAVVTYPVTVTDQLGREVTIEKEPETLVSGYYISTSLLLALNQQDKLTGVEAKAGSRSIYRLSAPSIIELPSVGTAKEFDLEQCAALHPDLVILPAKLKDVIPSLEELGITVLAVKPENQKLLEEAVTLLGTATGSMAQAQDLLNFSVVRLEALSKSLAGTDTPCVYLAGNSSLLSTAGAAMYQNSLITNAGGANAAAGLTDDYWAEISYEQLLAWDPEYIILASDADYTVESVLKDANLAECTAIKNGNVYQLPNAIEAWDSPVPSSVLGSLWLASVLHSEAYTEEDWLSAVTEYYETFYRFTPDTEHLYAE